MLIVYEDKGKDECIIGFDFDSSRHLLIACGWIMSISDFFGQTIEKLFVKKKEKIYQRKPINFGNRS